MHKHCNKCDTTKPVEEFRFRKDRDSYDSQCKECKRAYSREYDRNREDKARVLALKRARAFEKLYGIAYEDKRLLLEAQSGKCAICEKLLAWDSTDAHLDHNHATDEIRGILCMDCNHGIGKLKDSPEIVMKAYGYLMEKGHYGK